MTNQIVASGNTNIKNCTRTEELKLFNHIFRKNKYYQNKNIETDKSFLNYYSSSGFDNHNEIFKNYKTFRTRKDKIITSFNLVHTIQDPNFKEFKKAYFKDGKFFFNSEESQKKYNLYMDYFKKYIDFIRHKFLDHQAIGVSIHLDETNPHIHLQISAYNTKLKKFDRKSFMTRSFLKRFKQAEKDFIKSYVSQKENMIFKKSFYTEEFNKELKQDRLIFNDIKNDIEKYKSVAKDITDKFKYKSEYYQYLDYDELLEFKEDLDNIYNQAKNIVNWVNDNEYKIDNLISKKQNEEDYSNNYSYEDEEENYISY